MEKEKQTSELEELRKEKGVMVQHIAKMLGLSVSTVSSVIKGHLSGGVNDVHAIRIKEYLQIIDTNSSAVKEKMKKRFEKLDLRI